MDYTLSPEWQWMRPLNRLRAWRVKGLERDGEGLGVASVTVEELRA